MRIELSEEIGTEVRRLCSIFGVSEDALFRRLLKLPDRSETSSPSAVPTSGSLPPAQPAPRSNFSGYLTRDGIRLPYLLELRKHFKGQEHRAKVSLDGIVVDGFQVAFTSPSLAAMAITKYNVNGWNFWEYKDPKTGGWHLLNDLRQR